MTGLSVLWDERQFPGYLGTTIIAPEGNASSSSVRYIINRFKDHASLDSWEDSEEAIKLLEEVNNYTTMYYESNWSRDMI